MENEYLEFIDISENEPPICIFLGCENETESEFDLYCEKHSADTTT